MQSSNLIKFIGRTMLYVAAASCMLYALTYSAGIISAPSSAWQMTLAIALFITAGAILFRTISQFIEVEDLTEEKEETQINNQEKEEDNA